MDLGARGSPWVQVVSVGLAVLGAIAGFGLMLGDAQYLSAQREQAAAPLDVIDTVWPPWPQAPRYRAILHHNQADASNDPNVGRLALRDARRALDRDRADPSSWEIIGQLEDRWGSPARARRAYVETLRRLPWSPGALGGLMRLEATAGHRGRAQSYRPRLCRLGAEYCPAASELAPTGSGRP